MKRIALLIALVLCLPLAAHADDASRHAKAKELVILVHTERMVNQVSDNLKKQVFAAAEKALAANPTPENKAKLVDFEKKVSDSFDEQLGWGVMEAAFTDIYARVFTEDELTGIISFYKSPAGAAFLAKTDDLNTQIKDVTGSRINALQSQMNQSFDGFRKSLVPAPTTPPASAEATPK